MEKAKRKDIKLNRPPFQTIKNLISQLDEDQNFEGDAFRKIAVLSYNYKVPSNGCNTYRVAYSLLNEFEEVLYLNIQKENNIVFKRAITLKEELFSSNSMRR